VKWLSEVTGDDYHLPSEAEWEYAARAGTTTRDEMTSENANLETTEVGSYPNAWGLYDMTGNVWEWVEDCWNESYEGAPPDGSAWTSGDCSRRVLRGGSWFIDPGNLRSADRIWYLTGLRYDFGGFRVARTLR
jgi:formylglycine-generating enzyme required for sulfatase activity